MAKAFGDSVIGVMPSCAACGAPELQIFFRLGNVPVHQNLLMLTRETALRQERGDIALGFCHACGFVSNVVFDPALTKYSSQHENAQTFSPTFGEYVQGLATNLVNRYDLREKDVIEIGCGKGDFLRLLCRLGHNRCVGFGPSYVGERDRLVEGVTFIRDFYSERYAHYQADLICCRHVLEHIHHPADFLAGIRRSIGDRRGVAVAFEVPSLTWILRNLTFWDIFYEHCSYFTTASLARLFMCSGFAVTGITEVFGGQYLWLEASPDGHSEFELDRLGSSEQTAQDIAYFTAHYSEKWEALTREIEFVSGSSKRCVVWGAGAKGVTFLNTLGIQLDTVPYVVDVNPRKQGAFIPGTGQQIVDPSFLRTYAPDVIFVMNPNYLSEIRKTAAKMNLSGNIVTI
ncbi:MAG: class I SAM-dependent methyltransferase [Candidatus Marsarchaeota archaeon]|nr:class I SAM-dependent methyltransferase [Candidatus Marsarchaeota archaeon]